MDAIDIYAKTALPPTLAALVIAGAWIALGWAVVAGFVRARRRAALAATAEASVGEAPPALVEGNDVVLAGIVRHLPDQAGAVKVSVTQTGQESQSSGTWSHTWTEVERTVTIAPFGLELPGGEVILVEPPKTVDVADDLDQMVWRDRTRRVLSAELVDGERIFARGRLERSDRAVASGGYRDNAWGWALRASGDQMLLSSEPLGAGLRTRAAFHRGAAWSALVVLLALQTLLPWYYSRLLGHTEPATITGTQPHEWTDGDGDHRLDYFVDLRRDRFLVSDDDYARVHAGTRVNVRVGSEDNWALGSAATISWMIGLLIVGSVVAFWLWYGGRRLASRPWFRRKVHTSGSGELPDPPRA